MAQIKQVLKDQYLVREGDMPSEMYIIKSGSFAITQFRGNSELRYKDFKTGEMFGEVGLFDKRASEVNVKALQNSEVIVMPYETLHKQIDVLPTWIQALFKNLINHLLESIHFIHANAASDNVGPASSHLLTKYMAILNLTSLRHKGHFSLAALRNYTIQVFQEPTARMNTLAHALAELGYLQHEETSEGPGFKNLKPETLTHFLDWYNDWLFKPERARMHLLNDEETKNLNAIVEFAKDLPKNHKGFAKVNLNALQTESVDKTGRALRKEDIQVLTAKKYFSEPTMEDSGVTLYLHCEELETLAENCFLVNNLTRIFS